MHQPIIEYAPVMQISTDNRKGTVRRLKKIGEAVLSFCFWVCLAPCVASIILFGFLILAIYQAYEVASE